VRQCFISPLPPLTLTSFPCFLRPRQTERRPLPDGMRNMFHLSLFLFRHFSFPTLARLRAPLYSASSPPAPRAPFCGLVLTQGTSSQSGGPVSVHPGATSGTGFSPARDFFLTFLTIRSFPLDWDPFRPRTISSLSCVSYLSDGRSVFFFFVLRPLWTAASPSLFSDQYLGLCALGSGPAPIERPPSLCPHGRKQFILYSWAPT